MYTLDTNPIIYDIDDKPAALATLDDLFARATPIYTSTITELELFSYPALTEDEAARIEAFLRRIQVMPLVSGIARFAGDLTRLYLGSKASIVPWPQPPSLPMRRWSHAIAGIPS